MEKSRQIFTIIRYRRKVLNLSMLLKKKRCLRVSAFKIFLVILVYSENTDMVKIISKANKKKTVKIFLNIFFLLYIKMLTKNYQKKTKKNF